MTRRMMMMMMKRKFVEMKPTTHSIVVMHRCYIISGDNVSFMWKRTGK
jgi:hypothetical protein